MPVISSLMPRSLSAGCLHCPRRHLWGFGNRPWEWSNCFVLNKGDMRVAENPDQIPYRFMLLKRAEATTLPVLIRKLQDQGPPTEYTPSRQTPAIQFQKRFLRRSPG